MKIAITGSHGVGKTTLANELLNYFNQGGAEKDGGKNFKLLPEAARQAFELGFPINENNSPETQIWIFAKQLEMELTVKDNYIADKCFIDLLAYAVYFFSGRPDLINVLKDISRRAVQKYNLVIYLPSGEFPIEGDGVRSTDHEYQEAIDKLVREILNEFGVSYVKITGSKEERLRQALKLIKIN